jgi:hypothetical protein
MVSRQIQTPDFWRSFAPGLHIEDCSIYENVVPFTPGPRQQSELAGLVRDEGYFQTSVDWGLDIDRDLGEPSSKSDTLPCRDAAANPLRPS